MAETRGNFPAANTGDENDEGGDKSVSVNDEEVSYLNEIVGITGENQLQNNWISVEGNKKILSTHFSGL